MRLRFSGSIEGWSQWLSTSRGTLDTGLLPPICPPVRTKRWTLPRTAPKGTAKPKKGLSVT